MPYNFSIEQSYSYAEAMLSNTKICLNSIALRAILKNIVSIIFNKMWLLKTSLKYCYNEHEML